MRWSQLLAHPQNSYVSLMKPLIFHKSPFPHLWTVYKNSWAEIYGWAGPFNPGRICCMGLDAVGNRSIPGREFTPKRTWSRSASQDSTWAGQDIVPCSGDPLQCALQGEKRWHIYGPSTRRVELKTFTPETAVLTERGVTGKSLTPHGLSCLPHKWMTPPSPSRNGRGITLWATWYSQWESCYIAIRGWLIFISLNASVSFAKNDDLLFRQPLYFQGALASFIVNEIKLMRTLKTRHGKEMCKKLELFIYNQRRQMKDTARSIHYMQSIICRALRPPYN